MQMVSVWQTSLHEVQENQRCDRPGRKDLVACILERDITLRAF